MDVPEYESLNLLSSSCLAVHLLLVPLAPFLMVILGLLNCEHKGKKLSSPVTLSGKFSLTWTHEKSYWSVLMAWTLMAEEKLALVWWEALSTSSTAFGVVSKFRARLAQGVFSLLKQMDTTTVHCKDGGTFVEKPQVLSAPSKVAEKQTHHGRPQKLYSLELVASNGLQEGHFRKD